MEAHGGGRGERGFKNGSLISWAFPKPGLLPRVHHLVVPDFLVHLGSFTPVSGGGDAAQARILVWNTRIEGVKAGNGRRPTEINRFKALLSAESSRNL